MNSDYFEDDHEIYMEGRGDGMRRVRTEMASAMTKARKNASPEVQTALDALAHDLSLGIKTEVSYTA